MEWVGVAGSMVGVLTFVFGAFHYVVLKPLKESITDLRELIAEIQHSVQEDERMRHNMEVRMATFEEKLHSIESNYDSVTRFCMEKLYGHE